MDHNYTMIWPVLTTEKKPMEGEMVMESEMALENKKMTEDKNTTEDDLVTVWERGRLIPRPW